MERPTQFEEHQIKLWLSNPITQALKQCLIEKNADLVNKTGQGVDLVHDSQTKTFANYNQSLGGQITLANVTNFEEVLEDHGFIVHPENEGENNGTNNSS